MLTWEGTPLVGASAITEKIVVSLCPRPLTHQRSLTSENLF